MKNPIIQFTNLEYNYPGDDNQIIHSFSETIHAGEVIGIVGKNGIGKSTLMRLLASLHQPANGEILINGVSSCDLDKRREYLLNFFYISHDKILLDDYTLKEYFSIYSMLYPKYSKNLEESFIKKFKLKYNQKISSLSTGNKIKAYLIFAIATQTPVLLVDEITAVLDPENREEFFEIVHLLKGQGKTIVLATNIINDLSEVVDKVWFIKDGVVTNRGVSELSTLFKKKAA